MITFYQREPQKKAPTLEILDARGRVIRSVSGTHKVGGKDVPYVPNKAGLNRYMWDFNVNGPVKWNGASRILQRTGHRAWRRSRLLFGTHDALGTHLRAELPRRARSAFALYPSRLSAHLRRGDAADGLFLAGGLRCSIPSTTSRRRSTRRPTPQRRRTIPR